MPHTPTGGALGGTAAREPSLRGAAAAPEERPQSIGTVLAALRKDFPEVTVSRIRFLEAEGLVRPERGAGGQRRFRDADVRRLRHVLGLQRDHCLPLHAIRERLGEPGDGEDAAAHPAPAAGYPIDRRVRTGRARLLAATGADEAQCTRWEEYGLLRPDATGHYDVAQVALARTLAELGAHGLEPRHLRAVKAAADRSAALVQQVVAPLRANRDPRVREDAEATARDLAHLTARLHDAFLRAALEPAPHGESRAR
ncbi:MerR family transcriptional regulator [Streptomyces sp. DSM 42041]|uniref:MerR family transcriptional regulator n=1 Tax=Streptomyces hazeniae TaxID=3075538 RepID=A0ABU2P042_9ACTN|nr:MerR family transcriptional regulator [Streptomyces sp. DSM 42041]MDT0382603.1 MerR family transcriptional regulator [Streptomyces sp. DSM 42041]